MHEEILDSVDFLHSEQQRIRVCFCEENKRSRVYFCEEKHEISSRRA